MPLSEAYRSFVAGAALVCMGVSGPAVAASAIPGPAGDRANRRNAAPVLGTLAAGACREPLPASGAGKGDAKARGVLRGLRAGACAAASSLAATPASRKGAASVAPAGLDLPDGTVIARIRLGSGASIAVDVIAYVSKGLAVGGVLCYPEDARGRSTLIHVAGGVEGTFSGSSPMFQTCIDWALQGRVAFVPSTRGLDGSQGSVELCLGEADDVAAAAIMLRSLPETNPAQLALVGGSLGACVVLRASVLIPDLRATVAFSPPLDWKALVQYHRTAFAPGTEVSCEGASVEWALGGPGLADAFDSVICGHVGCTDAEYASRSPLNDVARTTSPTLVAFGASDNIVPVAQLRLWAEGRRAAGHPVESLSLDPCDPPLHPPLVMDVELEVQRSFHFLSPSGLVSGLIFLLDELDAADGSVE